MTKYYCNLKLACTERVTKLTILFLDVETIPHYVKFFVFNLKKRHKSY